MKINRPKCPKCGSENAAFILYGRQAFDDDLKYRLNKGYVTLGGCLIDKTDRRWKCNDCQSKFGNSILPSILFHSRYNKSPDYIAAHSNSFENEKEIKDSKICGCFYCLSIFEPNRIDMWIDDLYGDATAICPYCHTDAVIGDKSGFTITKKLLQDMRDYWSEEVKIQYKCNNLPPIGDFEIGKIYVKKDCLEPPIVLDAECIFDEKGDAIHFEEHELLWYFEKESVK